MGRCLRGGDLSVGLQAALLELRARLFPSLLAPAAALSVLEFSGKLFLLPIFGFFIVCHNPTAAWLFAPEGPLT